MSKNGTTKGRYNEDDFDILPLDLQKLDAACHALRYCFDNKSMRKSIGKTFYVEELFEEEISIMESRGLENYIEMENPVFFPGQDVSFKSAVFQMKRNRYGKEFLGSQPTIRTAIDLLRELTTPKKG